jgi:hypothetical protein
MESRILLKQFLTRPYDFPEKTTTAIDRTVAVLMPQNYVTCLCLQQPIHCATLQPADKKFEYFF